MKPFSESANLSSKKRKERFLSLLHTIPRSAKYCLAFCFILSLGAIASLICQTSAKASHSSKVKEILASSDNWGLSFQKEGERPIGNASSEELAAYDAYFVKDTDEKKIYLTFDAGYENGNMPKILEALKKHQVSATFFVVGSFLKQHPDLVRQMVADGHIIGNHTMTHPDMSKISSTDAFQKELTEVSSLYEQITREKMQQFYRPPRGIYSKENLSMAKNFGYHTFFWSLAYVDWYEDKQPSKEEAFGKLLPRIHPGAIVLLHSTSSTNAEILDELLSKWEDMGYQFGTLHEFLSAN